MYIGAPGRDKIDIYKQDSAQIPSVQYNNNSTLIKITETITPSLLQDTMNENMQTLKDLKLSSSTLDLAEIPLIDLESICEKSEMDRKALINKFGEGLREVGFVAVKAPASLISLISEVNSTMKDYFSQKIEEKENDIHGNYGQTGFSRQGNETAAGAKKADLKETYFIPPNFQRWPINKPEFQQVMQAYHAAMTQIAAQLMEFVAEYLSEPTEDVSKSMSSANNLVRLAFYPAPKPTDDPEAVWAAAHEDLNALTLLPPSTIPGLQLLTKDGKWKSVIVPQGYIIVNTGEQLQMKTAGMIKATRHQVINPGGEYARSERYASIFFASWSDAYSLKPFDSCICKVTANLTEETKSAYLQQFPAVNVKDNLDSRLIEMKTLMNPSEARVKDLRSKGLLRQPPEYLVKLYEHLF
jgi:isopenicillin N synthase-like dioxygenase